MQSFYYHDKNSLQDILESIAMKANGAQCQSYNYCKYCAEPKNILRKSTTPCADAYLRSGATHVYCPANVPVGEISRYSIFVNYKAKTHTVDCVDNSVDDNLNKQNL